MTQTAMNNFEQTTLFYSPKGIKKEPMDLEYSQSTLAPLDLTVRSTKTPSPTNFSPYSPPRRRTSLGSSPRSNSSGDSSELSSTTSDNFGFPPTIPTIVPRSKAVRPFKAYPKDPSSIALIGSTAVDIVIGNLGKDAADSYAEFRAKMLEQVQAQHNGTTNKNMRRNNTNVTNPQNNDPTYWEKRRKNNEAAKRSRDARRAKEDEIAIRCAFLEHEHIRMKHENVQTKHENMQLKFRIASLEAEIERLQSLLYH